MSGDRKLTRAELLDEVRGYLDAVPETEREALAAEIVEELLIEPDGRTPRGPISRDILDRDTYYVVPGDDLALAETSVGIAVGVAAVLKDPVSLLGSLCLLLLRFRRLAIRLDKNEGAVVLTLIDKRWRDDGATVDELAERLPDEFGLSTDDVAEILVALKDKRRRGTETPVVKEFRGRWWANDIW